MLSFDVDNGHFLQRRLDRKSRLLVIEPKFTKGAELKGRNTPIQSWYIKPKMANDKVSGKRGVVRGPKPKMTKEERRAKYTEIARKRRLKQQGGGGRGRGNYGGGNSKNKTVVCYQCRQPGHTIAECPNKEKNNSSKAIDNDDEFAAVSSSLPSSSICYKCGSTEHSLAQCPKRKMNNKRKQRNGGDGDDGAEDDELEDLPFATCFLCKQKGHLVSSCPQNQRGIYVNGGCCRICGSQQHRATDCPDNANKKKKNKTKSGDGDDGSDDDDDNSVEKLLEPVDHRTRNQKTRKKVSSSSSKLTKERGTVASSSSSRDTTQKQSKKRRVVKF